MKIANNSPRVPLTLNLHHLSVMSDYIYILTSQINEYTLLYPSKTPSLRKSLPKHNHDCTDMQSKLLTFWGFQMLLVIYFFNLPYKCLWVSWKTMQKWLFCLFVCKKVRAQSTIEVSKSHEILFWYFLLCWVIGKRRKKGSSHGKYYLSIESLGVLI